MLKTDYLVVGSGAVGMAFVDTLLSDTDSDILIVDRFAKPGGHWNLAYPFVTLHQPSAFYGVASRELSTGGLDQTGLNKGLCSLATGDEVLSYFDRLMQERFLPSGRVRYFPMSEYLGNGRFVNVITGVEQQVEFGRHVDATYLKTSVPSTHVPGFEIDSDVAFKPLNELPKIEEKPEGFVIIGGGKTGMDAVLWLLGNGVEPDDIRWVMPRDGWLIDRKNTQPDEAFFEFTLGSQAAQFEAIAAAENVDDLFDRLEKSGVLLRIDPTVKPTMFHGATISQAELSELRRVKNVIRMGRVSRISRDKIELAEGEVPTSPRVMHVDCSASAISNLETKPIFQGDLITPQTVRSYQPVFSASLVAHVEATRDSEEEKNRLCGVVPLPNHDTDWIRMMIPFMMNQYQWSRDPDLRPWLEGNRLDGFSGLVRNIDKDDTQKQDIMRRLRDASMPAMAKLQRFVAELDTVS
ncbi:MAG: NAD(P)/FAD-dependent oxidoreductase [Pseudomonadota bacterium]